MKRFKPWFIATIAAALTLSIVAGVSAQGIPNPPTSFTGTVTSPDGAVASDLTVEAYVGDTLCNDGASETYPDPSGSEATRYFVKVHHSSIEPGCGTEGATVSFRIGGRAATPTGEFGGGLTRLNLTLPAEVTSVTINVAVWRRVEDPGRLHVSTQAPGEAWVTHGDRLTMSEHISRDGVHRWDRSDLRPVEVELTDGSTITINVAVWRRVEDPGRLHVSTQAPGESWVTHPERLTMSEHISRDGVHRWDRSDLRPVEVELE